MCVFVTMNSDLGVLTDHVEPEDRCPGTLLLAGVGDDNQWEGGSLGCSQGINNFLNVNNILNTFMLMTFFEDSHITSRKRNPTCKSTDKPLY